MRPGEGIDGTTWAAAVEEVVAFSVTEDEREEQVSSNKEARLKCL